MQPQNFVRRTRFWGEPWVRLIVVTCFALIASTGCVHQTVIRSAPEGATILVDGEEVGTAPVVIERPLGLFGEIKIEAEQDSFLLATQTIERDQWFLWPGLLAMVPFFAAPLVVIPFAGPLIAIGWAAATSPTLLSLLFLRRYPAEVILELAPRHSVIDNIILPTDGWTLPDDYAPNPIPDGATPLPHDPVATPLPQANSPASDRRNPPPQGLRTYDVNPDDADESVNPIPFSLQQPEPPARSSSPP